MRLPRVAVVIEVLGIIIGSAGVGVEIGYQADLGFCLTTAGAVIIAAGSLIWAKFYRLPRRY